MSGLLCSGNVNIALLNDDGTNVGYLGLKNTIKLEIDPGKIEAKVRASRMIENFGQNLDQVDIPSGPMLNISINDVDAETVGMAFRGTTAAINLPAITAQDVALTVVPGNWYPLATGGYSINNLSVKSTAGATTYAEGTDYTLDADGALLYIKTAAEGGTIVAGDITATISALAVTGTELSPATKSGIHIAVRGRMKNLATGKYVFIDIPNALVSPSNQIDFLAGDFAVNDMSGSIKTVGTAAPYTVRYLD